MSGALPPTPGAARYALLDPARFRRPLTWLAEKGLAAVPLQPLDAAPDMGRVTPWLTRPDAAAIAALTALPAPDWGLWIESEAPLADLPGLLSDRRMIADGAGNPLIFRWWDRETLLPLWPVLTPARRVWLLAGLTRLGIPHTSSVQWLEPPAGISPLPVVADASLLAALGDAMAARRHGPVAGWIAQQWPGLSGPEQAGLAAITVTEARRLGLEEARDWQALAQLLALLGSGLMDDPLFAPLVAPLLLRPDRTRMRRTEPVLLGLGNARIAGGRKTLALLHTMIRHDALAASLADQPPEAMVRQVYGDQADLLSPDACHAAQAASDTALLATHPAASPADRQRFWLIRLLLGSGFTTDPLRHVPAAAYTGAGMAGLAAWAFDTQQETV